MTAPAAAASGTTTRLVGLDLARAVALIGMIAVHVVPATTSAAGSADTVVHPLHLVFGGRSSALFAVLAGVALALTSGRATPPTGDRLAAARRTVVARAGVVAVVGLVLGMLGSGVAVILVNYALLFVVALPWLGVRWRALAWWAAGWLVVSPVVSHLVRGEVGPGPGPVPSWISLFQPVTFVRDLVLTGYYPVLTWTGYLLVGLALGRSPLLQRSGAGAGAGAGVLLAGGGAVLAGASQVVSTLLLDTAGGLAHLEIPVGSPIFGTPIDVVLQTSAYGTTPTTSWWWLVSSGPHSGTPLDLLHTTGTALLVIGLCLALVAAVAGTPVLRATITPLAAAGAMTLTLYTGHVVTLAATRTGDRDVGTFGLHVLVAVAFATAWRAVAAATDQRGRGPLESMTALAADATRGNPVGPADDPTRR